jgi:hypothetical protein
MSLNLLQNTVLIVAPGQEEEDATVAWIWCRRSMNFIMENYHEVSLLSL